MKKLDPTIFAQRFVNEAASAIKGLPQVPRVLGIIASNDKPSLAYARNTKAKFQEIGINYDLARVNRLDLDNAIEQANKDPGIHGIF
ncbi:MAG: hypothetical protein OSB45_17375, partial [Pseudomonadales bacterium]|nr:hypothetical protein [Pseudomonadales bacterium]